MLQVFADVIVPVFLVAVIGGFAGRRVGLDLDTMSKASLWLFSPCLVFTTMVDLTVEGGQAARIVAVTFAVFVANLVVARIVSRVRGDDERTTAGATLAAIVPNQGNLALPISRLAFGSAGLDVAVVNFVAGAFLSNSVAVAVASMGRASRRDTLLAPFRYPLVYAAAAGITMNVANVSLPFVLRESLGSLAAAAIPVMLVVLGLQLHVPRRGDLVEPAVASANRLLIGPLVAWPVASLVGLHGVPWRTMIVLAGMPTAVVVTVLARELDARPELCVRAVILSTVLSLLTLAVLITLVK